MRKILYAILLLTNTCLVAQKVSNATTSSGSTNTTKDPIIIDPGDGTTDPGGSTDPFGSEQVGTTSGELSVSLSGAATYTVPISVPPGINGVVPKISINYNSQSGIGMAGYGWNVGGLSAITRIPSTKFHDSVSLNVYTSTADRFALDGQRLILKTGVYGQDGSTYETENFSNIKVTMYYTDTGTVISTALLSFKVEYPDGSIAFYGTTTNSRTSMSSSIDYWENPQGVRISYDYSLTNNVSYINSIKYGTISTVTPINTINFAYKLRARSEQSFSAGISFVNDKILSGIYINGNGVNFKKYVLAHDIVLNYERLVSITEKTGDGTLSYAPTVFSYLETSNNDNIITLANTTVLPNAPELSDYRNPINGDFDGDGDVDFILPNYPKFTIYTGVNDTTSSNTGLEYEVSLPTTAYTASNMFAVKALEGTVGSYILMNRDAWCVSGSKSRGDGTIQSLFYNIYSKGTNNINLEYTKEFILPTQTIGYADYNNISGDFNGDGLTDILLLPFEQGSDYSGNTKKIFFLNLDKRITTNYVKDLGYSSHLLSNNKIIKTGDVNGDGKTDIILFVGAPVNMIYVYSLNNNEELENIFNYSYNFIPRSVNQPIDPYFNSITTNSLPNINAVGGVVAGDFNGDGKTDFRLGFSIEFNSNGIATSVGESIILMSTGNSFNIESFPFYHYNEYNPTPIDFDNDGKTDIVGYFTLGSIDNKFSIRYYKRVSANNWTMKIDEVPINYPFSYPRPLMIKPSSANNGKIELSFLTRINTSSVTGYCINYFINQNELKNQKLLKSITLGNGVTESISYSSLIDGNGIYIKAGSIENFPKFDIANAHGFSVVSQIEKQSSSVYKKQLYKYYGATSDAEGLGFIGFRSIMKTNWFIDDSQAISSVTQFDITKRGAPVANFSALGILDSNVAVPSDYISRTINIYNNEDTSYQNPLQSNLVFKLANTKSISYNGLEGTSSETSTIYNNYNSPTEVTTISKNGTTTEQTTVDTFTYDPPIISPYMIDRPKIKTNITTIYSSVTDISASEETYTFDINLLKSTRKKVTNSGITTPDIIEINDFDNYGNIIKKTISDGTVSRFTNFEYDSATHRFLTKKTDIESLVTTYSYNTSTGWLLTEILPTHAKTTFTYDKWGKTISKKNFLNVVENYSYEMLDTNVLKKTSCLTDGSSSTVLIDDLGREISSGVKNIDNSWSYVDTQYDYNDRVIYKSQPYNSSIEAWHEMQFDVYGRLIQTNNLKSINSEGKVTTYDYPTIGLVITENITTNDGIKTKTTTKNSLGQILSVIETPGGSIRFEYFANGTVKNINCNGGDISFEQDGFGRKKTQIDPSAGTYRYIYNNFGEITNETIDNKGQTVYDRDDNGKVTYKYIKDVSGTIKTKNTYNYDSVSKLISTIRMDDYENNTFSTNDYFYDNFNRLTATTETLNQKATFITTTDYDVIGRLAYESYTATSFSTGKQSYISLTNVFKNGYKWKIVDDGTGTILWQTNTVNAAGNLLSATLGNGVKISNKYDDYGFPYQISHIKGNNNLMELNTLFDNTTSNLISRTNNMFGTWSETFNYDLADRLLNYEDTTGIQSQTYNNNGTIASNNIGTYAYTATGTASPPYRVSSITIPFPSAVYNYYNAREQNITYNLFKSPLTITENNIENVDFEYNAFDGRSAMFYGSTTSKATRPYKKYYAADGNMEIKLKTSAPISEEFITYIGGDAYTAPVILKTDGSAYFNLFYLHRDHQGTILGISNSLGAIIEKRQFDAWGSLIKYANTTSSVLPTNSTSMFLDRGYTGHEHLIGVGLINMNGRIYDPKLHKFLQPDNNIQDPYSTQNYNRYSYGMNNPNKYIDPTGESWEFFLGLVFNAYVHGAQATGDANPFNWGSMNWINSGLSTGSIYASGIASYNYNQYVQNYDLIKENSSLTSSSSSTQNHPYVAVAWIHPPTQHRLLGVNMTALSEGNLLQKTVYGVANQFGLVTQYLMGRSVGEGTMRNLDGTGATTADGTLAFGTLPLWFVGGGEGSTAATEMEAVESGGTGIFTNLKNWFINKGPTFAEYRAAYWANKVKPPVEFLENEATGQVWNLYRELHHRFIPQRWDWAPNWLKNNSWNLKELNSLEHAKVDPYRARFAPKWVKEQCNLIWK